MNRMIDKWIDEHAEAVVRSLAESVHIPSVSAPEKAAEGMPFGPECKRALNHALELCRALGLEVKDTEGYYGIAEAGSGEETIGVLAHLDIVPVGTGWKHAPFGAEIEDGCMYGRGTSDDKGGVIAMIYALAAVKYCAYPLKRRVRLIFGCDEEFGMGCIRRYLENEPIPLWSFSPDSAYPVVNREKSFWFADYGLRFTEPSRIILRGGDPKGGVPGTAFAIVPMASENVCRYICEDGINVTETSEDTTRIEFTGRSGFGSMPFNADNALQRALRFLSLLPLDATDATILRMLAKYFGSGFYGETLGLEHICENDRLTHALCFIDWNSEGIALHLDVRTPADLPLSFVRNRLEEIFKPSGFMLTNLNSSDGYYIPEDQEPVRSLLRVYRKRTGDMQPPSTTFGGTYARHLPRTVGFGTKRAEYDNHIHSADEHIRISDLIEDTKLIAAAICALADTDHREE